MDQVSRPSAAIPLETELKLALTREAAARLRADEFATAPAAALQSIYFDTPARAVSDAGFTLRLRRSGETWIQTLKGATAGLSRSEQEVSRPDGTLDRALLARGPLGKIAQAHDLAPIFETRVNRRTRVITCGEAKIELALDEGEILAGAASEPIRELEFELKSGDLDPVFALARRMFAAGGLTVSLRSKAERGFALASGHALDPVKFRPPPLDDTMTAGQAFQALAIAALHQVAANARLLETRPSLEGVHQARIGLRRLRAMVSAFSAIVGDGRLKTIRSELTGLTALLADARNLDVFISETFQPRAHHEAGSAEFGVALLRAQTRAYTELGRALAGPEFASALFDLLEWILSGPWTRAPTTAAQAMQPLAETALGLLEHRREALLKRGQALDWRDPLARHKLRIQAKKMRYLTDAFAPLFGDAGSFLKRLKRFQDLAGRLNDIVVAGEVARLALEPALAHDAVFAAGLMVGERRSHSDRLQRKAEKAFEALAAEPAFWS